MKVLVIMPTYGRIPFLNRAVASFLSQTYEDKELVIVNDDKNVQIKCEYPNITCINLSKKVLIGQKKNLATNLGYHNLYIPFDDDDIMLPNRIKNCVDLHNKNTNVGLIRNTIGYIIYGDQFMISSSGQNTISYTRDAWFEVRGYEYEGNNGEDQEFKFKNKKILEFEYNELIDYVYNWGGINYHASCSDERNIEEMAYQQLVDLNLLNKEYYINPDYDEYGKFVYLDKLYKEKKEPIKIKHIGMAKIKIL